MRSFFSIHGKDKILDKQYKSDKDEFFVKVNKMQQMVVDMQKVA